MMSHQNDTDNGIEKLRSRVNEACGVFVIAATQLSWEDAFVLFLIPVLFFDQVMSDISKQDCL